MNNAFRKTISILLCGSLLLGLAVFLTPPRAGATAADDLEESLLGRLSEIYESNGNPGAIAQVAGDPGGKSYGLYMFASASDSPKAFFTWCQTSSNAYYQGVGNTLSEAYYTGTPGYGPLFDAAWRALAKDNPEGFALAQRDHVRAVYYDTYVDSIRKKLPSFDIANYGIALRNVLWSRAIQHGVGGATTVFTRAMETLGGFANQPESVLINAIYAESGRLIDDGKTKMTGADAQRYGVEGKTLAYYGGCSASIQLGVYIRLRINEPAKAQAMLAEHGYGDAPLPEGSYFFSPVDNEELAITPGGDGLAINTRSEEASQQFCLVYYASGYYTITLADSGMRLSAAVGGIALAEPDADDAQFWTLVPLDTGFALQNRATGQYLSADSFAAGGRVVAAESLAPWQLVPGDANWSLEGASYPTYANALRVGASNFYFRGILRSTYPIQTVRAEVRDEKNAVKFSADAKPNALSYDLSRMDSAMAFSRLGTGSYTLIITAKDSSGSTFDLREPFFVNGDSYMVTFNAAGGECSETVRTFTPGQVLGELPTPSMADMAFVGWYDDEGTLFTGSSIAPARNLILTARYAPQYTYTFLDYDGTTVLAAGKLTEGEAIPLPADPSRPSDEESYFTFLGWEGYEPGMTMGAANVSFVAAYEAHSFLDLGEMISSGPYRLIDGYLRAIPAGATADDILAKLTPAQYISIHKDGEVVTGSVGTGMTVDFAPADQVLQSVVIVITGDVNGDGAVTLTDMVQLRAHLLGKSALKGAALQAADLNGDGELTLTDMVQLRSFMLGRSSITPR